MLQLLILKVWAARTMCLWHPSLERALTSKETIILHRGCCDGNALNIVRFAP